MLKPVEASYAAQLQALSLILTEGWDARSPQAAFAEWCFAQRGQAAFFAAPASPPDMGHLDQAPALAAAGYRLARHPGDLIALAGPWCGGASRIAGRNALPPDRMSFFFRPVELLGIALGAAAVRGECPQPGQWLADLLCGGATKITRPLWSGLLACLTTAELGQPPPRTGPLAIADLSAAELAALWLLLTRRPAAAAAAGVHAEVTAMHTLLLERIALDGIGQPDVAGAAVLHLCLTDALRGQLAAIPGETREQALSVITGLCRRFPAAARRLTSRRAGRADFEISDEYDVQDLFHALLTAYFDDIRPEEPVGSRAGAASRIDFLLKNERIVIETKMTRPGLDQRKVGEELIVDKERYRAHPDCGLLVCFVHDPGHRCANPAGLEADLTDLHAPLPTVVIVAPHD